MTKSKVWLHFEINKFDWKLAKFNLCAAEDIKRGNGTSNLWSHLELYHKDIFNKKIGKLEQQSQLILIQDKKTDNTSQDLIQNKVFAFLIGKVHNYYIILNKLYFNEKLK